MRRVTLNMGNITDDDTESMLSFVGTLSRMRPYKLPLDSTTDYDDAVETVNSVIEQARRIIRGNKN
jgi:hypothetical protein